MTDVSQVLPSAAGAGCPNRALIDVISEMRSDLGVRLRDVSGPTGWTPPPAYPPSVVVHEREVGTSRGRASFAGPLEQLGGEALVMGRTPPPVVVLDAEVSASREITRVERRMSLKKRG